MPTRVITKQGILAEIGNNIRKWRTLKGFKQEALADELEISKVSVSKIETGKTDISLHRLYQIALILDIPIEKIFKDPLSYVEVRGAADSI